MANDVAMTVPKGVPIVNSDVLFEVRQHGGSLIGKVEISKGGIDWTPSRSRTPISLSWEKFNDLMKGTVTPAAKKTATVKKSP